MGPLNVFSVVGHLILYVFVGALFAAVGTFAFGLFGALATSASGHEDKVVTAVMIGAVIGVIWGFSYTCKFFFGWLEDAKDQQRRHEEFRARAKARKETASHA